MPKVMLIAQGKDRIKSKNVPLKVNKKGMKVILIAKVAERMDLKNSVALDADACQREYPSSRRSI